MSHYGIHQLKLNNFAFIILVRFFFANVLAFNDELVIGAWVKNFKLVWWGALSCFGSQKQSFEEFFEKKLNNLVFLQF